MAFDDVEAVLAEISTAEKIELLSGKLTHSFFFGLSSPISPIYLVRHPYLVLGRVIFALVSGGGGGFHFLLPLPSPLPHPHPQQNLLLAPSSCLSFPLPHPSPLQPRSPSLSPP